MALRLPEHRETCSCLEIYVVRERVGRVRSRDEISMLFENSTIPEVATLRIKAMMSTAWFFRPVNSEHQESAKGTEEEMKSGKLHLRFLSVVTELEC